MQELEDLCEFLANQGYILRLCLDDDDDDDSDDDDIIIIIIIGYCRSFVRQWRRLCHSLEATLSQNFPQQTI